MDNQTTITDLLPASAILEAAQYQMGAMLHANGWVYMVQPGTEYHAEIRFGFEPTLDYFTADMIR